MALPLPSIRSLGILFLWAVVACGFQPGGKDACTPVLNDISDSFMTFLRTQKPTYQEMLLSMFHFQACGIQQKDWFTEREACEKWEEDDGYKLIPLTAIDNGETGCMQTSKASASIPDYAECLKDYHTDDAYNETKFETFNAAFKYILNKTFPGEEILAFNRAMLPKAIEIVDKIASASEQHRKNCFHVVIAAGYFFNRDFVKFEKKRAPHQAGAAQASSLTSIKWPSIMRA